MPPDLHGFLKWVFGCLDALNKFVFSVVVARREHALVSRKRWLDQSLYGGGVFRLHWFLFEPG